MTEERKLEIIYKFRDSVRRKLKEAHARGKFKNILWTDVGVARGSGKYLVATNTTAGYTCQIIEIDEKEIRLVTPRHTLALPLAEFLARL